MTRLIRLRLLVTFGIFVMLGFPEGVLGTAWPSMRGTLDQPVSALAVLTALYTGGYLIATVGAGRLNDRWGTDGVVRGGVAITLTGLVLYAASPVWSTTILAALVLGIGAGTVDAAVNADVALRFGPRVMHLLHASFGVGATLGPLLATLIIGINVSWRVAYVVLAVLELVLLVGLFAVRTSAVEADEDAQRLADASAGTAERPRLVLWATLVYFFFYVGTEVSLGQWSYSVLTEDRGVGETAGAIAVAAYWGGLTVGRLLLGVVDERLSPQSLLRWAMLLSLVGLVWFGLDAPGSILALPLVGLAFAGVFPSLVLLTSAWLDTAMVTRVVGYQLAASSLGAIVTALAMGAVADGPGLDAVPLTILLVGCGLVGAHLFTEYATSDTR